MRVDVNRVDMWVASIEDVPGGLSDKLDTLANADVDLEFISARRAPDKPGKGVVFVTPIKGPKQIRAARKAGFEKSKSLFAIRVATGNKPGYSADLTMRLAEAGLNLRGISGATISNRAIFHIAFDSSADVSKAIRVIK
jgi:hypothetical protein